MLEEFAVWNNLVSRSSIEKQHTHAASSEASTVEFAQSFWQASRIVIGSGSHGNNKNDKQQSIMSTTDVRELMRRARRDREAQITDALVEYDALGVPHCRACRVPVQRSVRTPCRPHQSSDSLHNQR